MAGERNFEIGDKVFDIRYGWGEVEGFEVRIMKFVSIM